MENQQMPEWLTELKDYLISKMKEEAGAKFEEELSKAVAKMSDSDLDNVKNQFLIFVLEFTLKQFDNDKFHYVAEVINEVINVYKYEPNNIQKLNMLQNKAKNAAYAALAASWPAAYIAAKATAKAAAGDASWAASEAAYIAARAAAWAANAAATDAVEAAAEAALTKFVNKLIEILKESRK